MVTDQTKSNSDLGLVPISKWRINWYESLFLARNIGPCVICGDPVYYHSFAGGSDGTLIRTERCIAHDDEGVTNESAE